MKEILRAVELSASNSDICPSRYHLCDSNTMELDVSSVLEQGLSVRTCSHIKSRRRDQWSGSSGHTQWAEQEENKRVSFLLQRASVGYPRTRLEVVAMVCELSWWNPFVNITRALPFVSLVLSPYPERKPRVLTLLKVNSTCWRLRWQNTIFSLNLTMPNFQHG